MTLASPHDTAGHGPESSNPRNDSPPSDVPDTEYVNRRLADTPIAIVGMSALLPGAKNIRDYWQNIVDGTDCTTEVPQSRWDLEDYYDADRTAPDKTYSNRGAFIPDVEFDPVEFGMPPNQLEVTSTMQTLSLGVVRDLLGDAGAKDSSWYDPSRTGVVIGTTGPVPLMHPLAARLSTPVLKAAARSCGLSEADTEAVAERYVAAFAPWEENSFPGLLANVVAGRIANRFGLGGMNCTVDAACAASLAAIRTAIAELVDGRADTMITGGVDTENSIFIYLCFSKVGALSPTGQISPFSDNADGTLLGEGICMLALRRLSDARRDGNKVYAVIKGIGSSSDGRSNSIYAPHADGQRVALQRAYDDARCEPSSVELFEAHATGTAVGDKTELTALGKMLRANTDEEAFAALGSVKSQIGHTKGAAGTASLIKLALGLHHKILPGTINVSRPNPVITDGAPYYVNSLTRPWVLDPHRPVRRAAVSAMGFGGTNFHMVLEEADTDRSGVRTWHQTPTASLWHAQDVPALIEELQSGSPVDGGDIPATDARIGFVWVDEEQRSRLIEVALETLARDADSPAWNHPEGIYFRRQAQADLKVGALFSGQGSQYVNMAASSAMNLPPVAGAFDDANAAFEGVERRLGSIVFPPPAFDDDERAEQEELLKLTEHAQPAIGAVSVGQYRFLSELGFTAEAFGGHSFGELGALWASGALETGDYFRLARARGAAMAKESGSDRGTMLAVRASRSDVDELVDRTDDVYVCNHNAPDQVVVGGGSDAVADFAEQCAELGWNTRTLPVSAAFHTPYVAHATGTFREAVDSVTIGAPQGAVYGNDPERVYGPDAAGNADILVDQLMHPVEFVAVLRGMRDAGCTTFVEFGPKQVLTSLVRRTLGDEVIAIPTDIGPMGDGDLGLKRAAVALAVLGMPLSGINRYQADPPAPPRTSAMAVTISAPEYVPETRRKAYADVLANGYRIKTVGADDIDDPVRPDPVQPNPLGVDEHPTTTPHTPAERPEEFTVTQHLSRAGDPNDGHLNSALNQHLDTHREFLGAQLGIARDLADALRRGNLDDGSIRAIEAVSNQSVALSDSHSQAAHVLVGLAELEAGLSPETTAVPARARRSVTVQSSPAPAISAPVDTEPARSDQTTNAPAAHTARQDNAAPVSTTSTPPAEPSIPGSDLSEPAAEPPAAPSVPAVDGHEAAADDLHTALREVIAEKTGYPVEMIGSTMDLESDLGVDSIKRVQVLGAVQERFPHLPSLGPEQLGELRTIDQIVEVISEGSDAYPKAPAAVAPRLTDHALTSEQTDPIDVLPSAERTPVELVALPRIDRAVDVFTTDPTASLLIVGNVSSRLVDALSEALRAQRWRVTGSQAHSGTTGSSETATDQPTDSQADLCVVILGEPTTISEAQQVLSDSILAIKAASKALIPKGRRAALLAVTTVDGALGFGDLDVDPVAAMAAGIGGAVKTLAAERPELFCRAVDVNPLVDPDQFARTIIDESHDSAVDTLEVGVGELGERHTLVPSGHGAPATELSAVGEDPLHDMSVGANDLLVVSGGARGVTALCVRELAARTEARFILLGRTDPSPDPDWAQGVDDASLQGAAIRALAGSGLTPRDINSRCAGVRAGREIRETLNALGERGQYLSVDVTDADALRTALAPYRQSVTGIIHGAGVLADSLIASKEDSEIARVLTPKLRGIDALMDSLDSAADDSPVEHLVLFTSVAGLFGNRGQSDYATANEALGRFAVATKRRHPERHVTAIDWGAWDAGMVDDVLRAHFRDNGVELLHPRAGAVAFAEQFSVERRDDVVVLIGPTRPLASGSAPDPVAFTARRVIEDLARHPIIEAHRIGEKVVLPATFALGAMINVAERALPGRCVRGVRDFRVLNGVSFPSGSTVPQLLVHAEPTRDATTLSVRVTSVDGERLIPHYVAQLLLADNEPPMITIDPDWGHVGKNAQFIYDEGRQFHGPALRGLAEVLELSESRLVVTASLPEAVVALGAYQGMLHNPVQADLILQVPPVLAHSALGAACLPMGVGSIDFYHQLPTGEAFTVVADNLRRDALSATVDAVAIAQDNTVLQRWNDVSVVTAPDLSAMFLESARQWN